MFQAEHADHFAFDAYAGVEHRADIQRLQVAGGQFAGARIVLGVVRVDGAAAVQCLQVLREITCVYRR